MLHTSRKRAVGLDQHVDRHIALEPAPTRNGVDAARRHGDIGSRLGLGHHQVGQPPAAQGKQGVDFRFEGRVGHRMHARAHAAEAVRRRVDELCDQLRMLDFGADRGAVLGIERGIEDGRAKLVAQLALQRQALAHARFNARIVVANGKGRRAFTRAEERIAGMSQGGCIHEGNLVIRIGDAQR